MIGGQPFHSKRFQLSNQEFPCPCMSHVQTVRKASRPPASRDFSPTAIPSECLHWPIGWIWPPESIPPLVLRAIIFDSMLVFALIAFRRRKKIAAWWQARRQSSSRAALASDESLSSAP